MACIICERNGKNVQIIETKIPGLVIVEPRIFTDARGYFFESFSEKALAAAGLPIGEDRAVIALDDGLDQGEGTLVVNHLLERVGVVDGVEGEAL